MTPGRDPFAHRRAAPARKPTIRSGATAPARRASPRTARSRPSIRWSAATCASWPARSRGAAATPPPRPTLAARAGATIQRLHSRQETGGCPKIASAASETGRLAPAARDNVSRHWVPSRIRDAWAKPAHAGTWAATTGATERPKSASAPPEQPGLASQTTPSHGEAARFCDGPPSLLKPSRPPPRSQRKETP